MGEGFKIKDRRLVKVRSEGTDHDKMNEPPGR